MANASDSDNIGQQIISSSESYERYFDTRGSMSASGWGASVSANMAYSSDMQYNSNQVLLVAYRDILIGRDGMVDGQLPPLTEQAKDYLC